MAGYEENRTLDELYTAMGDILHLHVHCTWM